MSVSYLQPNWSAPAHVKAFSTTRQGGLSGSVYGSFNIGAHVGDSERCVNLNRQKLCDDLGLPSDPVWLSQIHGTEVINLDALTDGAADRSTAFNADGTYSSRKSTVCVVMTADCLPLLLTDREGTQVAAVHVGWRGLAKGIIENAVAQFTCTASNVIAWAGPCIGPDKFEIGDDVRQQLGGSHDCYSTSDDNTLLANLHRLCGQRLKALGVEDYVYTKACTYSDSEQYFSYRRDGECGRMASLIWIDSGI